MGIDESASGDDGLSLGGSSDRQVLEDQSRRWAAGDRVLVESYLARFPSLRTDHEALLDLIFHEVVLRERAGDRPTVDEYRERFPDLAGPLDAHFAIDGAVRNGGADRTTLPPNADGPVDTAVWSGSDGVAVPGYQTLGELGRGGMGVVYRARQLSLNRVVALKVIRAGRRPGDASLARFRREAEVLARLQHPNIVQVFDLAESDGIPYLAMEYVAGGSLADRLRAGPLPPGEAARLVATLARAVHAAHRAGIVHRDLKPANALLTADGTPKVADFGLAKLAAHDPGLSAPGAVIGTPRYMAPEQAEGTGEVGPAADVYALGAILYECLTARPPFNGPTPSAVIGRVLTSSPDPFDARVPVALQAIALKCLAKSPADRYPTAEALADALDRSRAGPDPTARNRRAWLVGCAVVALVAGVSLAVALWPSQEGGGPTAAEPAPLSGDLSVEIWSGGKPGLRVGRDAAAVPVRNDEQVHLHATLNRPGYVYLIWLGSDGVADPLYPWPRYFPTRPAREEARFDVHFPPEVDHGLPMEGPDGLETALLLARNTPLPADFDLKALLGAGAPAPLRDPHEVAVRGFDQGGAAFEPRLEQFRGLGKEAERIDEPLVHLVGRLRPHFEVVRAVRFAHKSD
jgi:serine/threonine protein kinase